MKNHLIISLLILSVGCKTQKPIKDLTDWYENGNKKEEGNYYIYHGRKGGLWTKWYENGNKKEEGNYYIYDDGWEEVGDGSSDIKVGLWTNWYKNGQKEEESTYKDGELISYKCWYKNGQKRKEETYKDGELVEVIGRWKEDGSVGS